jgi:hypothetical protein
MCFPFTAKKCGVDLLQTAIRSTLNRLVSIHQTMTPHLNRMTFMSALCKTLRIYPAKATRRDSTFIRRTQEQELCGMRGCAWGDRNPAGGFWSRQGCTNVIKKNSVSFLFIYKVDLNYECVLPPSIFRSTHNPSHGGEDVGNIRALFYLTIRITTSLRSFRVTADRKHSPLFQLACQGPRILV